MRSGAGLDLAGDASLGQGRWRRDGERSGGAVGRPEATSIMGGA
jgi:hypothetical protein